MDRAMTPRYSRALPAIKSIAMGVGGAVFGLLLAAAIVAFLAVQFFDYQVTTVESGSMEPTYVKGDIVVIRPASMEDVKAGDIVLYNEPNTGIPFIHRVVGVNSLTQDTRDGDTGELLQSITEYEATTKGDANPFNDATFVTAENFRGKAWFSIPSGAWFGDAPLAAIFVGAAVLIAVLWVLFEVFGRLRKRDAAPAGLAPAESPVIGSSPVDSPEE